MSIKLQLPYLETMLTYSCTLGCKNCSNYSDYGMKGGAVKWHTAKEWFDQLFTRVSVRQVGFIGGEPFLNSELDKWVYGFRESYPHTSLMVVTNAQLFVKNLWFLDAMGDLGKIHLKFSVHIPDAKFFNEAITTVLNHFPWDSTEIEYNKIYTYKSLKFEISYYDNFRKTYQGDYSNMKPYNSDPIKAIDICEQRTCPLLHQGKLYKCSSLALLDRVLEDHNQLGDIDWQPYIDQGLRLDCDQTILEQWVDNYDNPHRLCSMCPTEEHAAFHPHWGSVINKIKIY